MEVLMIATYAAICWGVFRLFKIPVNGYTLATAALGGVFLLSFILLSMNYSHPFTSHARFYFHTTAIVPRVSGLVTEVPVVANEPVQEGDVLFRIDPQPYERVVERLEAELADASTATKEHASDYAGAQATVRSREADRDRAKDAYDRHRQANLDSPGAEVFSEQRITQLRERYEAAQATVEQAQQSAETARLEAETRFNGSDPAVARLWAQLKAAQYDLESTTVRAPTDGEVVQLALNPGAMAASLPLRPVMVFRHSREPVFAGAFLQGAAQRVTPGSEAEVILDTVPGKVFPARVSQIVDGMAQGQMQAGGDLIDPERDGSVRGRFVATLTFDEDLSEYQIPAGSSGQVAVYTEHFHHFAIIRKILLRMKSWLNFVFSDGH